MMRRIFYVLAVWLIVLILVAKCSKTNDPVSFKDKEESQLLVHTDAFRSQPDSPDFHGNVIQQSNWNLAACLECHGTDYAGGIAKSSCLDCHDNSANGCVFCHGGKDNLTGAPPYALTRADSTTDKRSVGAHTAHLKGGIISAGFDCEICHKIPGALNAQGHVDSDLPAELTFSGLSITGNVNPQWNGVTCANTYCHGSFAGGNSSNAPLWTKVDGTQADCGTCHGLPPVENHPQGGNVAQCSNCHGAVVDENNNIINKALHINGVVDALQVHPDGWLDSNSPDFHGLAIRNSQWDLSNCQECHGADYAGGSTGISCLTCHSQTPEDCVVCHGGVDNQTGAPPEDIDGNTGTAATGVGAHTAHLSEGALSEGFECSSCHVVPNAFITLGHVDSDLPAEITFSGLSLTGGLNPQWNGQSCQNTYCHGNFAGGNAANEPIWTTVDGSQDACGTCHGLPPGGSHPQGDAGSQCSTCHGAVVDENNNIINKALHINGTVEAQVHPDGWLNENSPDFHGLAIRNNQWDLANCQECHGTDYAGGTSGVSCLTCHSQTPEDCVVCHGGVDNQTGAPPEDIDGNTVTTATGVGAHTTHLSAGSVSNGFECRSCHVVPNTFSAIGHVDSDLPADITFSGLSLTGGVNPQWNGQSCQNTYCHGNFAGGNLSNAPAWTTVDGTQDACGTCHGLPPANDHPQGDIVAQCNLCHGAVVDENNNIINKSLHINGENESQAHPDGWLNSNSPDFHGKFLSENQWNLANCQQCHGQDYSGGIANSTCLTCHPGTPEDCVVCHGGTDNQTGAPPQDLGGNTDVTARGVGVHTTHLTASSLSAALGCESCHVVPGSFSDAGHVDSNLPAELVFGDLAKTDGANPLWDNNNLTCANSYCHGNWSLAKAQSNPNFNFVYSADDMTGNNASPAWTDATSAACGTCHGLPPTGHNPFALADCAGCHGSVIDASGNIIDNTKHINGMINVFDQEYPMF